VNLPTYMAVLGAALLYIVARERIRITISATLLIMLWVLYGVGYFYFASGADEWTHVSDRLTLALAVMWVSLVAGMELGRVVAGRAAVYQLAVVRIWDFSSVEGHGRRLELFPLVVAWAIAAILIAVFLALDRPAHISQFLAASNELETSDLRLNYSATGSYAFDVLLAVFAPFVCCYLFVMWLSRRGLIDGLTFLALAVSITLSEFATLHKLPWVLFLLQLLIAHRLVRSITPKVWHTVLAIGFAIGAVGIAASLALPEIDLQGIASYLLYRSAYVTNEGLYQTFYVYPDFLPHTNGYNIGLIQSVFGRGHYEPAQSVVAAFFGAPDATFNAMFIADAWVDFGFAGVAFMSVVVGLVVKLCDCFYFSFGKSAACIAGLSTALYGVLELLSTAAPTAFLSGGLVLLPATLMFLRIVRDLLSRTSNTLSAA